MSRLNVENIRHPDAASDSLQLSNAGNVTAPGNLSVTGTSTLTDDLIVDTDTLFVDASTDRVGIGTTNPSYNLHIKGGSAKLAFQPTADTQENNIFFRNAADDATSGSIAFDHGNDCLLFRVGTTERLRILSDGTLRLLNSTGIDFSQIQTNAAGMTSEILDSYEEGNFTPVLSATSVNVTYTAQQGHYTKIGRTVFFTIQLNLSTVTSVGTGDFTIGGLPFSGSTGSFRYVIQTSNVNFDATRYSHYVYKPLATTLGVLYTNDNASWSVASATDFAVNNGAAITVTGFYKI